MPTDNSAAVGSEEIPAARGAADGPAARGAADGPAARGAADGPAARGAADGPAARGARAVDLRQEIESALPRAHARLVALVRELDPGLAGRRVAATPEWTVGELVAHVLTVYRRALGDRRRSASPAETAALNATVLAETPERDLTVLAELLDQDGPAGFAVLRAFPSEMSFRFHGGTRATVTPVSSVILAEILIHGRDLAEATDTEWVIPPDEAALVLAGTSLPGPDGGPPIFAPWLKPGGEQALAATASTDDPVGALTTFFRRTAPTTPEAVALSQALRSF
ncbi:maleylpyruvate isomerase N-terminal domain-containing protein [Cryptosporangium sp. NPDC048952]|uniref:maleylpyruvate isomerase N-terminal domain-containing protein n=1 Tax=Cryptosporangium sp. NPDC048952 TaxID=3363961 RepID=UPI00371BF46C